MARPVSPGLTLVEHTKDILPHYNRAKVAFGVGMVELPPNEVLIADLKRVKKIARAGGIRVELPKTADGGVRPRRVAHILEARAYRFGDARSRWQR